MITLRSTIITPPQCSPKFTGWSPFNVFNSPNLKTTFQVRPTDLTTDEAELIYLDGGNVELKQNGKYLLVQLEPDWFYRFLQSIKNKLNLKNKVN